MSLLSRFLLAVVRVYQYALSPLLPRRCRFHPTCSAYAATAITRFGAWKGGGMGVRRILRCHPYNPGGYDPVPDKDTKLS